MLDKPSGLCVIPPRAVDARECLRHQIEDRLGAKVYVVHRIDRETSGVVLMARTPEAHRVLNDAFADRKVSKTYWALVSGGPSQDSGVIDVALAPARKGRMRPARPGEEGLAASTSYRVIERFPPGGAGRTATALVEFEPHTGRQHQIRVHARHAGCPILGDRLYASQVVREQAERLMLHALKLRIRHPNGGAEVEFAAPLARDFESLRQRLVTV